MSAEIDAELSGIALLRSLPYVNLNLLIKGYIIENFSESNKVNCVWDRGLKVNQYFFLSVSRESSLPYKVQGEDFVS